MRFAKLHGIGNDYIFVDGFREELEGVDLPRLAREISDRHTGVGSDGLILALPSERADLRMRMFNADGSEGEMCGNGLRCLAKFAYEHGICRRERLVVETLAGDITAELSLEGGRVRTVRVDMGRPRLARGEIPMAGGDPDARVVEEPLEAAGREYRITAVSMGNPHCVIFRDTWEGLNLEEEGRALEHHPLFPRRTNVEFVRVAGPQRLEVRVWERGSGATLACGTGACAALVAACLTGRSGRSAVVALPGGELSVEWAPDERVFLTGPAQEVCTGDYRPG